MNAMSHEKSQDVSVDRSSLPTKAPSDDDTFENNRTHKVRISDNGNEEEVIHSVEQDIYPQNERFGKNFKAKQAIVPPSAPTNRKSGEELIVHDVKNGPLNRVAYADDTQSISPADLKAPGSPSSDDKTIKASFGNSLLKQPETEVIKESGAKDLDETQALPQNPSINIVKTVSCSTTDKQPSTAKYPFETKSTTISPNSGNTTPKISNKKKETKKIHKPNLQWAMDLLREVKEMLSDSFQDDELRGQVVKLQEFVTKRIEAAQGNYDEARLRDHENKMHVGHLQTQVEHLQVQVEHHQSQINAISSKYDKVVECLESLIHQSSGSNTNREISISDLLKSIQKSDAEIEKIEDSFKNSEASNTGKSLRGLTLYLSSASHMMKKYKIPPVEHDENATTTEIVLKEIEALNKHLFEVQQKGSDIYGQSS